MVIEGVPDERVINQAVAVVQALPEGEALVAVQDLSRRFELEAARVSGLQEVVGGEQATAAHSTGSQPFVDSLSPATGTLSVTLS